MAGVLDGHARDIGPDIALDGPHELALVAVAKAATIIEHRFPGDEWRHHAAKHRRRHLHAGMFAIPPVILIVKCLCAHPDE